MRLWRHANVRMVVYLLAVVVGALVLAEWLLSPPNDAERMHLATILAAPAFVAAALVPPLRSWVSSRASFAGAALAVGLMSLALGAGTSSAATNAMFLSDHDYRLFLVVLVLSCGIALVVGSQLTRPLSQDLARLGHTADRVASGDLSARTGVQRPDEVGRTATAMDSMVAALELAAQERAIAADARAVLLASIGHDLRTPLAAMRAAVESLQDGIAPDPDKYLALVGGHLDQVEVLLDQLLSYARLDADVDATELVPMSLAELADDTVDALTPLADRHGVRLLAQHDDAALVLGDAAQLSRVLRNLVDNAICHAPQNGNVIVRLERSPTRVVARVIDDGPGFDAEFRSVAFDPFSRADAARDTRNGHAGLGLTICKALVENHHGTISIDHSPGVAGGHLVIELPAAPTALRRPLTSGSAHGTAPSS